MSSWPLLTVLSLLTARSASQPLLLMVMLDGLRWDALYNNDWMQQLPTLSSLLQTGARTERLIPDFQTSSYTNFLSIMTGVHPDVHGIIANKLWDSTRNKTFKVSGTDYLDDQWWALAEPFWLTAEKQRLPVYMFNWPYCAITVQNRTMSYCDNYEGGILASDFGPQLKEAVQALHNGSSQVSVVYSEQPDRFAHYYGFESDEVLTTLKKLDADLAAALRDAKDLGLDARLNIMIFSDHGFGSVNQSKGEAILAEGKYAPEDYDMILKDSTLWFLWPKAGKIDKAEADFRNMSSRLTVYRQADVPDRLRIKNGRYMAPLMVKPQHHHVLIDTLEDGSFFGKFLPGQHGWDNEEQDMSGIFLAQGPAFTPGAVIGPVQNIELYQLMCHVMSLEAAPHNGTWSSVSGLLQSPHSTASTATPTSSTSSAERSGDGVGLVVLLWFSRMIQ